ncbi:helix-turn-helix domain-containing protein [Streptomyces sp. NPDC006288]|uniref:helix-turn-helix domain-containing protein n=1 Tax=Streptomyces sp. NPDC006288 TaxID=3156743 RepID=UPI0033A6BA22
MTFNVSLAAYGMLAVLKDNSEGDAVSIPVRDMALIANASTTTVRKHLNELEDAGCISINRSKTGNTYTITK